jgi:hypothetical protein
LLAGLRAGWPLGLAPGLFGFELRLAVNESTCKRHGGNEENKYDW